MTHDEIRRKFIDFSVAKGHTLLPPALLVPQSSDPTVLFTVAGMQQFKSFYEQPEDAPASRVVTIQPCIRTVDIDEVGDATHLTLFEMLGHFSFGYTGEEKSGGPYFKQQSLEFGWEFLTKILGVAPERIRATYFGGDAQRPADEVSRLALESLDGLSLIEAQGDDNFWGPVGNEGPCGPNAEFYIDNVEVWNSVFNEYYKESDGGYRSSEYKGVDMGTGFERLVSVIQDKQSVYDTDLHLPFITFVKEHAHSHTAAKVRIIVDHVKAALFLLAEGVVPGNKTREYVLRRLIRRAVREGQTIGFDAYTGLLVLFVQAYGPIYPHLANEGVAKEGFETERQKFLKTLQAGTKQLQQIITSSDAGEITGEQAFKLFDTFGFPIELTREIANESGWTVDVTGFEEQFSKHKEQSRSGIEKIFQGGLADHEEQTVAHHTAHHLLLAALREVLGPHVVQRGSNITADRLRIDVSHPEKITDEQLQMVTELVNQKIEEDLPVINEMMDRDSAIAEGALAEFGAKYPKEVSVYSIINQDGSVFSRELCGGPHAMCTGDLGRFELLKEEASSAGVRRLRARVVART